MNYWLDAILNADTLSTTPPMLVVFSLLLAFVLGQLAAWVYIWTHTPPSYSQTYVTSLVVLPVIVAHMMIMVAGSVVLAFGLLAVFAVVRFRNVLKDTRDTTFVLWVIVEGMSVGTFRFTTAIIGAIAVSLILIYLRVTSFGRRFNHDAVLSVEFLQGLEDGVARLQQVFRRHAISWASARERNFSQESSTLSYRLSLRDPDRADEFRRDLLGIDHLRLISLYFAGHESEL